MSKIMTTTCDICGKSETTNLTENEVGTFDCLWSFTGEQDIDICPECIKRIKQEANIKPAFRDVAVGLRETLDRIADKYNGDGNG